MSAPRQGGQDEFPLYFFVHGTALKLCRWEIGAKNTTETPIRFYKQITNERLFSDQETGMNACFVICEEQKQGIAEIFPCFPQNGVVFSPSGIDLDKTAALTS